MQKKRESAGGTTSGADDARVAAPGPCALAQDYPRGRPPGRGVGRLCLQTRNVKLSGQV